ncbi:MAG: Rpn family recombination-promoting nuclease/putative transposase [Leptospira sp.]|nr:Rpn family recombination-promoting nuclease/putative transposase [Leptospira sp.]
MKGKQSHDPHVKKLLSVRENAIIFFEEFLPEYIKEDLILEKLDLVDKTFISKKNKEFHADMMYSIPGNSGNIICYMLFEHKSYYDQNVFDQLLGYLGSVYRWQRNREMSKNLKQYLEPVIPFVFYHGKRKWDLGDQFLDRFPLVKKSKYIKFIPNFEIILFELNSERLLSESLPLHIYYNLQVMQTIRKTRENIIIWLRNFIERLENEGEYAQYADVYKDVIEYLEGSLDDAEEIIQEVKKEKEGIFMGMFSEMEAKAIERGLEKGMEQGMEKGIEKGLEKGMEKGIEKGMEIGIYAKAVDTARRMKKRNMSLFDIIDISGLTEEELKKEGIV